MIGTLHVTSVNSIFRLSLDSPSHKENLDFLLSFLTSLIWHVICICSQFTTETNNNQGYWISETETVIPKSTLCTWTKKI